MYFLQIYFLQINKMDQTNPITTHVSRKREHESHQSYNKKSKMDENDKRDESNEIRCTSAKPCKRLEYPQFNNHF